MIVALIVICEVGFWVLLAGGLALRYLARKPRLGAGVLLLEPLLEVVLLVVTAVDLRNGAAPDWKHGLAALYIGYTVAFGHYTVTWLDGHAAHRLAGAPPPAVPPRHGTARAWHETKLWLRTVLGAAVAIGLLQLAILYVGDANDTGSLAAWQSGALRVVVIHGIVALTYWLRPRKPSTDAEPAPAEECPSTYTKG
ncbi:hypothetical protein ACIOEX_15160 [Streptomyces sp. NPDC087850]|uniref:hypothetical protein n=1 Tax=Streptomyces sp. NPDC087850 TaxID=3365809 RepID=UPI0038173C35